MLTRLHISRAVLAAVLLGLAGCNSDTPTETGQKTPGPDVIAPAAVADLRTSSPTPRSIVITWTAPGDDGQSGTATAYDIRYAAAAITNNNWDSATSVDNTPVPIAGGQLQAFRVLGLLSAAEYHFALKTRDEVSNESDLSNSAEGTTANEFVPPDAVTDLVARPVDPASFLLTWTASGDDEVFGTASVYDIRYSQSRLIQADWESAIEVAGEPTPVPSGNPDSFLVTGVEPSINYFFAIKVGDEVPNWSDVSNAAPALAAGNFLWTYPGGVSVGSKVTVVYEAGPDTTLITVFLGASDEYVFHQLVPAQTLAPGVYSMKWDFRNENGHLASYPYTYYRFKLWWNGVEKAETTVWLRE